MTRIPDSITDSITGSVTGDDGRDASSPSLPTMPSADPAAG